MTRNHFKTVDILRCSIGLVYVWFGVLKFFPGLSPADQIARETIHRLTFGIIPDDIAIRLLAVWESVLGVMLLGRLLIKPALVLLFIHMLLTFTPFLLFPRATFQYLPYGFTLLGQYIFKNIIIICAAKLLWELECRRPLGDETQQASFVQEVKTSSLYKKKHVLPKEQVERF